MSGLCWVTGNDKATIGDEIFKNACILHECIVGYNWRLMVIMSAKRINVTETFAGVY